MVTKRRFSDKAFAMLYVGHSVGSEIAASSDDYRAWVTVHAFIAGGPTSRRPYQGVGSPAFDVWRFEVLRSSLEAGYDIVGELKDELHVIVTPKEAIEDTVRAVEEALLSWSIDPASLGPLDDDFPL